MTTCCQHALCSPAGPCCAGADGWSAGGGPIPTCSPDLDGRRRGSEDWCVHSDLIRATLEPEGAAHSYTGSCGTLQEARLIFLLPRKRQAGPACKGGHKK